MALRSYRSFPGGRSGKIEAIAARKRQASPRTLGEISQVLRGSDDAPPTLAIDLPISRSAPLESRGGRESSPKIGSIGAVKPSCPGAKGQTPQIGELTAQAKALAEPFDSSPLAFFLASENHL
ncbi:MAG: hypothetical protein D6680_17905 [Cyanobacteria bacterium J007]|nr:MAG: hypothetical protein D6680_17905 [Cyanobacteria bacterium J007]